MARIKTEADREKEQNREEPRDTSGIPVGEEIPNLEDLASPSVAGTDLDSSGASKDDSGNSDTSTAATRSSANQKVTRGMVTVQDTPGDLNIGGGTPARDQVSTEPVSQDNLDEDYIDPELVRRQQQESLEMEARRQAAQPNTDVFQTEVEQRQAALKQASKLKRDYGAF